MTKEEGTGRRTSTFSSWCREQKDLDSWDGYRFYDIDCVWWNKKDKFIMLIEIKEGGSWYNPKGDQDFTYHILEEALEVWCTKHKWFWRGRHILQLPNKDMSVILLDGRQITEQQLANFLL